MGIKLNIFLSYMKIYMENARKVSTLTMLSASSSLGTWICFLVFSIMQMYDSLFCQFCYDWNVSNCNFPYPISNAANILICDLSYVDCYTCSEIQIMKTAASGARNTALAEDLSLVLSTYIEQIRGI